MNKKTDLIRDVLSPQRIRLNQSVSSKKKALELCAEIFAESDDNLDQDSVLEALMAREKMGSTALEYGIALPHCRITGCEKPMCALITFTEGVDFEARDNQLSDLLCALIVPEDAADEHLEILASIASLLGEEDARQTIRSASDSNKLYLTITDSKYAESDPLPSEPLPDA